MSPISDLLELKTYLGIDPANTNQDIKLSLFLDVASQWIEEILDRPLNFKSRTEYYAGTGTQKRLLRARPVYTDPVPQVFLDEMGFYGARSGSFGTTTQLTWGTDFVLQLLPSDEGWCRSGLLIRINNFWPKPPVRERGYLSPYVGDSFGSIKVIYTAGFLYDNLPAPLRMAVNFLVARFNYVWPLGLELNSESYEERSISIVNSEKHKLLALVTPMILPYRNWRW